jgi:hypothetical protein
MRTPPSYQTCAVIWVTERILSFCWDPEYSLFRISMVSYLPRETELHCKQCDDSKQINKVVNLTNSNIKITHSLKGVYSCVWWAKSGDIFVGILRVGKGLCSLLSSLHESLYTLKFPILLDCYKDMEGWFAHIGTWICSKDSKEDTLSPSLNWV